MKVFLKDVKNKNYIWSIAAFGIPFVISVIICAFMEIYPFGDNCILHIDMYHQYCPFFMEFREKLVNGESLLYSWNIGLGADFIATYAYYLASPMNWLLLLCPEGLVIEFMTVTTWIKVSLCGLFFFWFLVEKFKLKESDGSYRYETAISALVFSLAYAFSGFVAAYSWNIMWMDSVALAPLVVLGLEQLVKEGKSKLYYITLSLSILSNYYISLIMCIFLVLYFCVLFLEEKQSKIKACLRFAGYSLLAGGTAAVLLIPEALALGNTATAADSAPTTIKWYFGLVEELSRLCIAATPHNGTNYWPNIYCGVFTVFLVLLYCFNTKIRWTKKIPRILLIALFLGGFANNILAYIWHGLHFPNSLPARQSFLFILVMLMIGFETYQKKEGNKIWHVVLVAVVSVLVLFLGSTKMDAEFVEPSSFWLTIVFVAAYALCFIIDRIGTEKMKVWVSGLVVGLAAGEIIINMAITGYYSLDRNAYLQKMQDYKVLLEIAEADARFDVDREQDVFYRVEDYERKTKNDDSLYGYASGTLFSSLTNARISDFYKSVYMESGKNMYCYNGATPVISAMLSTKYMLSDNAEGENALRNLIGSSNGYYLYENTYSLPLGFMMDEEAVKSWEESTEEKIQQINELGYALGIPQSIIYPVDMKMEIENGITTISISADGLYYADYEKCTSGNLTISINDGPGTRYSKTTHRYLLEVGECKAGDVVTIKNTDDSQITFRLYRINMAAVEKAFNQLNTQTMFLEKADDAYIRGSIYVTDPGRMIFSIPYESGWKIYVDGQETEMLAFQEAFLSVYLEEGQHTIELKYMTPGLAIGAIISVICIGLFILTEKMRKKEIKWAKN